MLRAFSEDSLYIKSFWIEGLGYRNIDNDRGKNCQFLAKSENWANLCTCCSYRLIINDECLVYIHSLDFSLNTHITKIVQFHISKILSATGHISPFVVLPLCKSLEDVNISKFYNVYLGVLMSLSVFNNRISRLCITKVHQFGQFTV